VKRKASAEQDELPHADPKEIVLARANFVLEHMDVLPPYHVFYSNSECIAVWCKTGRWSTLQTAVWCSTNSVGALKTSTLTTIGVAAANPLLAPVIAVGGLIWVSAPMVILQKSRAKWEEATLRMNDLFWSWASPKVFVAAVENWCLRLAFDKTKREEEMIEAAAAAALAQTKAVVKVQQQQGKTNTTTTAAPIILQGETSVMKVEATNILRTDRKEIIVLETQDPTLDDGYCIS
jgi:hypothetical protein